MVNPNYVKVGNKKYKLNTDFRTAIECDRIAKDDKIGNFERALAIIYKLYGDEGLKTTDDYEKLLELGMKFLLCGEQLKTNKEKPDMDFIKDEKYIKSSFKYDYGYNPYEMEYMHWWDFFNDLNNLSNSELGDCCILNRVRNFRNLDLKSIKDPKERAKAKKIKEEISLEEKKKVVLTEEQEKNRQEILKRAGLL